MFNHTAETGFTATGAPRDTRALRSDIRADPARRRAAILLIGLALGLLALAWMTGGTPGQPILTLSFAAAAATLFLTAVGVELWPILLAPEEGNPSPEPAMNSLLDAMPFAALLTSRDLLPIEANGIARDLFSMPDQDRWLTGAHVPDDLTDGLRALSARIAEAGVGVPLRSSLVVGEETWDVTGRAVSEDRLLWQIDPVMEGGAAVLDAQLPVLAIGPDGRIANANAAAIACLGRRPRRMSDIFGDAPVTSGTTATARIGGDDTPVLGVDLPAAGRHRQNALIRLTAQTGPSDAGATDAGTRDWDRFDNLPVPLLWLSSDGRVQKANRNAVDLIGPGCRAGAHLGDLTEGLGRPISDWLDEAVAGHRTNSPEFLRVTATDQETFVQISLKPVNDGGETSLLAVLNDATELKTLEAQFVQSQKMQAIGQLAGGVAHDFNNLLTAISGHCDLLLLRHDQGDQDYADLMQINQNANRAAALVSQLLAFSRKQTLRPEEIDLRETISDLTHLLNRLVGEKVTLSFSHDPVLNAVRADKRQLEQVLMNLVVNARDAIPGGGEIRIVTEGVTYSAAHSRDRATVPPGDYVAVKVIDTGCGIPPDKLTKVFEPFYTTKRVGEGTGLGLSTAYGIIKQTGGYIFVDSTVGEGTCFTLLFRAFRNDRKVMEDLHAAARPAARHADGVVLLVEDEAPVRAFASRALRLRGYTVLEAESGEEALALLENPDTRVDIFVTDVVMPGMDGPTWVRKALETRPNVQIIFVSGYAEEHFGEEQTRFPNSVFLPKPFSLSELTQTVQGVAS